MAFLTTESKASPEVLPPNLLTLIVPLLPLSSPRALLPLQEGFVTSEVRRGPEQPILSSSSFLPTFEYNHVSIFFSFEVFTADLGEAEIRIVKLTHGNVIHVLES